MVWKPITDLAAHWRTSSDDPLHALVAAWEDQADRLRVTGAFQLYMEKLRREIAIETGVIERLYTIDRGTTLFQDGNGRVARCLACSVCAYHRDVTDEGESIINDVRALTDDPFQFSYMDNEDNLAERFKVWLESAIVAGLEYWNRGL